MNSESNLTKRAKVNPIVFNQKIRCKEGFKDVIILFRDMESYVIFCEDAEKCAPVLSLPIITDADLKLQKVEFPIPDLEKYLPKIVRSLNRIVICDLYER